MALESKPLFHPEVIRQHVRAFSVPDYVAAVQPKLEHWADLIASGQADELKETALLPDFLTDFFCGLLGCRPKSSGMPSSEQLGEFSGRNRIHLAGDEMQEARS
jgi:hypothetical protein